MKKKFLAYMLTACMLICSVPVTAAAAAGCGHHDPHTEECGVEGVDCTFICDSCKGAEPTEDKTAEESNSKPQEKQDTSVIAEGETQNDYSIADGHIIITATAGSQTVKVGNTDAVEDADPVITGASTEYNIVIEGGGTAKLTLKDVNIDVSGVGKAAIVVDPGTHAKIKLEGENSVKSANTYAGIEVKKTVTKNESSEEMTYIAELTIDADSTDASLTAIGGGATSSKGGGAGIGGSHGGNAGIITINGGTIVATGGTSGAGIGGGCDGNSGTITINGGNVKAECSGNNGAGIGGGRSGDSGVIIINGGEVTATGGVRGSGIGSGSTSGSPTENDKILITGGIVTACGGQDAAGIGGGNCVDGVNVTITGGEVTASGGRAGAGIGGGWSASGGKTTISGGTVEAVGGDGLGTAGGGGAGIGSGGVSADNTAYNGGEIIITGGTIYAEGGSGVDKDGNPVTGSSGTAGGGAAGIGGACRGVSGDISITGGTVEAVGGDASGDIGGGAGIGAGSAQGVGKGYHDSATQKYVMEPATVIIGGKAIVKATGGKGIEGKEGTTGVGIGGGGNDVEGSKIEVSSGTYSTVPSDYVSADVTIVKHTSGSKTVYYVGNATIEDADENKDIVSGDSIEVLQGSDVELNISAENVTVTNNSGDTIKVNNKEVAADGSVSTEGTAGSPDPDTSTSTPSSSSRPNKYSVSKPSTSENGGVKTSSSSVRPGRPVTITPTPEDGYTLDKLTVTDKNGNEIEVTDNGDGTYSFIMPKSKVEIDATFTEVEDVIAETPPAETPSEETAPVEEAQESIVMTIGSPIVSIDGEEVVNDVSPVIKDERAMLPIRVVANTLGADVAWDDADDKVTITKDDMTIEIFIGQPYALVNGTPVQLDAAAFLENDRTYLPLRFVANTLGAEVLWDDATNTVTIIPGK